jgi:RNA polymerase sigma-70 factor (ECF subfamily)
MDYNLHNEDRELLKRAVENDTDAFNQLHRKYRRKVINYAYRYIGNYAMAEETAQETFIKIYENLDKYKPTGTVRGWIYTIAVNTAKNKIRQLSKRHEISLHTPLSYDGSFTLEDTIEDKMPLPDTVTQDRGMSQRLHKSIGKLKSKYKEIIILCGIQGLSYKEASEITGCSIKTVGIRLMRAREQLKKILKESEEI